MSDTEKPMPELLTVTEVAKVLRVTSQAVRDMIRRGNIQAVRLGRQYRIPRSELDRIATIPADTDQTEGKP